LIGAADFNGDGHDDILLQDKNTGNLMIDLMNGTPSVRRKRSPSETLHGMR
jgi:hypothetical protein